MTNTTEAVKKIVRDADAILVTAGAGMGVDSGLPDFRGNEGFWNAYPVAKKLGLGFVELANPQWFESDPALAWAFYGHRLHLYRDTFPHAGFSLLLDLAKKKEEYFVFTSNVDGQFQKAGFDEEKIVECHGSIHHLQCTQCNAGIWRADNVTLDIDMENFKAADWPHCFQCGATARPNILMFGDWGWDGSRTQGQEERFDDFLKRIIVKKLKLVIIEIGAGTAVPTVRLTGEEIARKLDGRLIRINPRESGIDPPFGYGLPAGGLEGIRALLT
ncbi:SIR2 family NAD-dependent protein deacylase [Hydrogenimonas cancrithermarum]|uniref:protein acetyllysine N-acetyltransferase n=1 Tax=Hydrogenimonas cancrithermarum TaxID=2993563 RepID=A0ABN6WTY2_9BACT|nr:Sir2 family NAD-dependent protein deacetylase [Hydrogenimonas cancrithermarum]BDY12224.1 NAD-dependent protein deacetylase [Hydrogenimonas cancrithermarum]